jgi:hypothetical protein
MKADNAGNESRRTPTTPSLRRGQTEWYGPTVIGRAEACEGGFQVQNALQHAPRSPRIYGYYFPALLSYEYCSRNF